MHSKSDNTTFMADDNRNDVVDALSESLFSRYQTDFIFDSGQLLYYKCHSHKIYFERGDHKKIFMTG